MADDKLLTLLNYCCYVVITLVFKYFSHMVPLSRLFCCVLAYIAIYVVFSSYCILNVSVYTQKHDIAFTVPMCH